MFFVYVILPRPGLDRKTLPPNWDQSTSDTNSESRSQPPQKRTSHLENISKSHNGAKQSAYCWRPSDHVQIDLIGFEYITSNAGQPFVNPEPTPSHTTNHKQCFFFTKNHSNKIIWTNRIAKHFVEYFDALSINNNIKCFFLFRSLVTISFCLIVEVFTVSDSLSRYIVCFDYIL